MNYELRWVERAIGSGLGPRPTERVLQYRTGALDMVPEPEITAITGQPCVSHKMVYTDWRDVPVEKE